jgi:hypothetical protein
MSSGTSALVMPLVARVYLSIYLCMRVCISCAVPRVYASFIARCILFAAVLIHAAECLYKRKYVWPPQQVDVTHNTHTQYILALGAVRSSRQEQQIIQCSVGQDSFIFETKRLQMYKYIRAYTSTKSSLSLFRNSGWRASKKINNIYYSIRLIMLQQLSKHVTLT